MSNFDVGTEYFKKDVEGIKADLREMKKYKSTGIYVGGTAWMEYFSPKERDNIIRSAQESELDSITEERNKKMVHACEYAIIERMKSIHQSGKTLDQILSEFKFPSHFQSVKELNRDKENVVKYYNIMLQIVKQEEMEEEKKEAKTM